MQSKEPVFVATHALPGVAAAAIFDARPFLFPNLETYTTTGGIIQEKQIFANYLSVAIVVMMAYCNRDAMTTSWSTVSLTHAKSKKSTFLGVEAPVEEYNLQIFVS